MSANHLFRFVICLATINAIRPNVLSIESIMKRVVKEAFCSSEMSRDSIEGLHTCLKESTMSGNRLESVCIEKFYQNISGYYTQLCNESVDVEVTTEIHKCMADVCRQRGMDPYYDHYYCYYINHEADNECTLLALGVPETIKQRALVAHKITEEHHDLQKRFCNKLHYKMITVDEERLKVIECLIIPRKELYQKCLVLYKEKHPTDTLDPDVLFAIECGQNEHSDGEVWIQVCLSDHGGHVLK